jgi:hypothetical protein
MSRTRKSRKTCGVLEDGTAPWLERLAQLGLLKHLRQRALQRLGNGRGRLRGDQADPA